MVSQGTPTGPERHSGANPKFIMHSVLEIASVTLGRGRSPVKFGDRRKVFSRPAILHTVTTLSSLGTGFTLNNYLN